MLKCLPAILSGTPPVPVVVEEFLLGGDVPPGHQDEAGQVPQIHHLQDSRSWQRQGATHLGGAVGCLRAVIQEPTVTSTLFSGVDAGGKG